MEKEIQFEFMIRLKNLIKELEIWEKAGWITVAEAERIIKRYVEAL